MQDPPDRLGSERSSLTGKEGPTYMKQTSDQVRPRALRPEADDPEGRLARRRICARTIRKQMLNLRQ